MRRTVPAGISVLHYLGGLAVLVVVLQTITGLLLMAYYRPSPEAAYASISIISDEIHLGWLVRSLHRWGGDVLILLALVHMVRVYFSHAYAAPRQLSWVSGIVLLAVILAFDCTGRLLPWDQQAYWSAEPIRQVVTGIPLVGNVLLALFWGATDLGDEALLRFYAVHIGFLPGLMVLLLSFHLFMVWRFGIKEPPVRQPAAAMPMPFFPDFFLNLLLAFLLGFGVLLTLVTVWPPPLAEQADPLTPLLHVERGWYFLPGHQLLRHLSSTATALIILVVCLGLVLVPLIDGRPSSSVRRTRIRRVVGSVIVAAWVLCGVLAFLS